MRTLRIVGSVIFNNRIHVILMPVMLTLFWSVGYSLPLPLEYYAMIAVQTAGAYWWNMLTDRAEDSVNYPREGRFVHPESRWTRLLIAACFTTSFFLGLRAGWRFVLFGFFLNTLGSLYGMKLRLPAPFNTSFRIKSVPWLKNAYSSLFWSVALVLSPYVYLHQPIERRAWIAVVISFCLAYFVELMWDVRDMAGDRFAGVRTIPLVLGERPSRFILHGVNGLCTALVLWSLLSGQLPVPYWVLLVHSVAVVLFVE